jgi:transcriptional regulator with XRE-family HTH domain
MITGAQIRAARLLLHWGRRDLADRAKLDVATVRRSEATEGEPMVTMGHAIAIRYTLERAGVIFVEENGAGPGVRLKK